MLRLRAVPGVADVLRQRLRLESEVEGYGRWSIVRRTREPHGHQPPQLRHRHVVSKARVPLGVHPLKRIVRRVVHAIRATVGREGHIQRGDAEVVDEDGVVRTATQRHQIAVVPLFGERHACRRVVHLPHGSHEHLAERRRAASVEARTRHAGVHVDVCERALDCGRVGVHLTPGRRTKQAVLFARPRCKDYRAARLPTLPHE
mmetsp:Transcript_2152/g.6114  ORF Transcript_2152/g.6114 Transcript_2152/m.6114 type:complete len:203 (+) Transcript_2152:728-1336(+)